MIDLDGFGSENPSWNNHHLFSRRVNPNPERNVPALDDLVAGEQDGWRPRGERFDDFEDATFDSWAYDPDDRLGLIRRPTSEWDDPSWVAVEFSLAEYNRLRAADEANRDASRGKHGGPVRSTRNHGFVYYAVGEDGLIKIGCSKYPRKRMVALHAKLLATEVGSYTMEHQRHLEFAAERVRGEWFRPAARLLDHVAAVAISGSHAQVAS